MDDKKVYIEIPEFTGENVPIDIAAKIMRKDRTYISQGLINGRLPFGRAFKKDNSTQYDYYISPKLFWEFTGYIYRGKEGLE